MRSSFSRKSEATPNTGLSGPYILTLEKIDEIVTRTSPGAYALDKWDDEDGFYVHRIGRSDKDIKGRLKQHIGKYIRFKFIYSASPKAAFEKECQLYHDWSPPDNPIHPNCPEGTNWTCPVADCNALELGARILACRGEKL